METLVRRPAAAFDQATPGQSISFRFEPRLIADADPALVEQTLRILLQNAVKYAPGSPIEISGRHQDGQVVLGVRDHGPGIDEDELPVVFERFQRGGRRRDLSIPGMGLGLYLARHLVQANGGEIWIESPADGGANVLFSLPALATMPE